MVIKGYLFALLYGAICLLLALIAYKLGLSKNYTRKMVHILIGFEWVILFAFFGGGIHTLSVCLIFTLLLIVTYFKKLTPMIASEGDNSPGTVYYGVAMSVMATVCLFVPKFILYFGIGVFTTSLGDGFAGLVGQSFKKCNPKIYGKKTLLGFLSNVLISFFVPFVFDKIFGLGFSLFECAMLGIFSAGVELISTRGLDNISVTFASSFLSFAFVYLDSYRHYIIPILLTPFIIALVLQKKALTPFATVLAVILDVVISLTLGNFGFLLLLAFLVGSVLIDKIKRKGKQEVTKRGEYRDAVQVIANGLIPMIFAMFFALKPSSAFLFAYIASLAEAFADTAASGIGSFANGAFDIFKWKKCEKGISGGVSRKGTAGAFVASFFIPLLAMAFGMIRWQGLLICSFAAFFGVFFDSFLGSLLQVKYKCKKCGALTEKEFHCKYRTQIVSGFEFFDNDVVNLFSGATTAIIAAILAFLV